MKNEAYEIKPVVASDIAALVKLGKYDWTNSDIEKFPFEKTDATSIEVIGFDKSLSSEDAIKEMDAQGLRPATATELLLLGAQHPELQRKNYIVALGTVRQVGVCRLVASLSGSESGRYLDLSWWDGAWGQYYRFAAVRKSSVALEPGKLDEASSVPLVAGQHLRKGQKVEVRDGKVFHVVEPKVCKTCKRPL